MKPFFKFFCVWHF